MVYDSQIASVTTDMDELKRERDRFRALVEVTSDWLWEVDAAGRYTYCRPHCRTLLGYEPEEMVGRPPFDFMSEEEAARVAAAFAAIVAERRAFSGLVNVNLRKDGSEVILETSGVPLLDEAGVLLGYRGVDRDVTQRHRAHLALEDLTLQLARERDRAETANRVKSRFLAVMGHELRTPLNAVIGFSDLMLEEVLGPLGSAQYREYARDIRDSGTHLLGVVTDILEHAKLEAGSVSLDEDVAAVEPLLSLVTRMLVPLARRRGVRIVTDVPDGFPSLFCDSRRLQQALLNLAANAVRFSDPGGEVTLTAAMSPDGVPSFVVADRGAGMSPKELAVAISPFGQVSGDPQRAAEGSGLGLPIAIRLVELHGGTLEFDSVPGAGTVVTIRLPGRVLLPAQMPAATYRLAAAVGGAFAPGP